MLHKVLIRGVLVPIHAKNDAQLQYAVKAMTDAINANPRLLEEYRESSPDAEQDGTINSAAIGRPYPY